MATTLSAFDTSPGAAVTSRSAARRRCTSAAAAASPGRWFSATAAPAPASSSTVARPMPEPPPVTSARLPRRSNLMLTSVGDCLVHRVRELHAHPVIARLDHQEADQLFLGIDPEVRAASAGPPVIARRSRASRCRRCCAARARRGRTRTPSAPARRCSCPGPNRRWRRTVMSSTVLRLISRTPFSSPPFSSIWLNAGSPRRAGEPQEPEKYGPGWRRLGARASASSGRRSRFVVRRRHIAARGRQARRRSVLHPERSEDAPLEELVERHPARELDDAPERVEPGEAGCIPTACRAGS